MVNHGLLNQIPFAPRRSTERDGGGAAKLQQLIGLEDLMPDFIVVGVGVYTYSIASKSFFERDTGVAYSTEHELQCGSGATCKYCTCLWSDVSTLCNTAM